MRKYGYHILPTDVIENIPKVLKTLLEEDREIDTVIHEQAKRIINRFEVL